MRRYTLTIIPVEYSETDFDFTVVRHGEPIYSTKGAIMPGLERCNKAIAKDLADDPME